MTCGIPCSPMVTSMGTSFPSFIRSAHIFPFGSKTACRSLSEAVDGNAGVRPRISGLELQPHRLRPGGDLLPEKVAGREVLEAEADHDLLALGPLARAGPGKGMGRAVSAVFHGERQWKRKRAERSVLRDLGPHPGPPSTNTTSRLGLFPSTWSMAAFTDT